MIHQVDLEGRPNHVAIIMDGNKRWAVKNNTSVLNGHRHGLDRAIDILKCCNKLSIKVLSLFAFSADNWRRSEDEIKALMHLFKYFYRNKFDILVRNGIRLLHSGSQDRLKKETKEMLEAMVEKTKDNGNGILNIAFNYSGREEIVHATNKIVAAIREDKGIKYPIDEKTFKENLFNPELPYPELLIRTSGEQRISNFLLWQMAYTELYFTDVLWPDFTEEEFIEALNDYKKRERRFGGRIE